MLPEKFCSLPWLNMVIDTDGLVRPCCKYVTKFDSSTERLENDNLNQVYNSKFFIELRQKFLDGEKPLGCQECWNHEDGNVISFRQSFHNVFKDIDIDFYNTHVDQPIGLDLKLMNVCNLKCKICSPWASSSLTKDYELLFNTKIPNAKRLTEYKIYNTENEEKIKDWAQKVQFIQMTGGEPMTNPENLKILSIFEENSDISRKKIAVNTNVTNWNQKIIDKLLKFESVAFHLSIDDLEHRQEYHRYPSKWAEIEENVEKYLNLQDNHKNVNVNIHTTVSIFNIFNLEELHNWTIAKKINIHYELLVNPYKYNIQHLPDLAKDTLKKRIKSKVFNKVLSFLNLPSNLNYHTELLLDIKQWDEFRSQSFVEVYPEWSKIIGYT